MTRLEKFMEKGAYNEQGGRIADVMRPSSLPEPLEGMTWQKVESFNFADELLENAGLKQHSTRDARSSREPVKAPIVNSMHRRGIPGVPRGPFTRLVRSVLVER